MLTTVYRPLSELTKLHNNPRTIRDKSFKTLCNSLLANGDYFEARPLILSNRTGELVILAGNQRYEASKEIGLNEVPTVLLPDLTEAREREIIIRDNVSNGEWDMDELANSFSDLPLADWDLPIPKDWLTDKSADDYSDKNKEINLDDYEEKMEFKLKLTSDEFFDMQERLSVVKSKQNVDTNEQAIFELLAFYERHDA